MIERSTLPKTRSAQTLEVSTRSFYAWKTKPAPIDTDAQVRKEIQSIALEFPKYGYRRIMHELRRRGKQINHKRIRRIMKEEKLIVKRKKRKPKTTQSNHSLPKHPNLIKDMIPFGINQVWVADITFIRLQREFVYLASIMDLYSRRCVGYALSRNPDTYLTLDALNRAIALRGKTAIQGCIHHSDQGVQYAAAAYTQALHACDMQASMGEVGNSYENAHAESFFKTLKNEEVWMNEYETMEDVYHNIMRFIEEVYNKKRLHSSIGYMPPIEFEQKEVLNISIGA